MKVTIIIVAALFASPALADYNKCMHYQREDAIADVLARCMTEGGDKALTKFCHTWAETSADSERNIENMSSYCRKYAG